MFNFKKKNLFLYPLVTLQGHVRRNLNSLLWHTTIMAQIIGFDEVFLAVLWTTPQRTLHQVLWLRSIKDSVFLQLLRCCIWKTENSRSVTDFFYISFKAVASCRTPGDLSTVYLAKSSIISIAMCVWVADSENLQGVLLWTDCWPGAHASRIQPDP